jgi:sulfopyruvate decarboxylase TPP-binding subunit
MARSLAHPVVGFLAEVGISHVIGVPDNTSAPIYAALAAKGGTEIRPLCATREGEAMALASGLWLGGAQPAVLIQNTGLLESGDALRGTASRMGVPLLLLITCRGYAKARAMGLEPGKDSLNRDVLVRADLDSVAHMTEETLGAWGIPYHVLRDPEDPTPLRDAWEQARAEERPVAVLLDPTLS